MRYFTASFESVLIIKHKFHVWNESQSVIMPAKAPICQKKPGTRHYFGIGNNTLKEGKSDPAMNKFKN